MKRLIALLGLLSSVHAGIQFADQTAGLQVKTGARVYVDTNGQTINGTLTHESGGIIDGTPLTFANGKIIRDGKTATFTGMYDADAGPVYLLSGNDRLEASRNYVVNAVTVTGTGNELGGTPVLTSAITLPSNTNLACDITTPLNKDIIIDGGIVTLNADLACANEVALKGSGTVALNGYKYSLAGYYEDPLNSTLTFTNARNFALQGKLPLSGDWTFSGTSIVDGKGATIDLTHGGSLRVASDSRLVLRDMLIRGVNNTNIILADDTATLEIDRCQLNLETSVIMAHGTVLVSGDSIFRMKDKDWTFQDAAILEVDSSVLSLNVLPVSGMTKFGTIFAPDPIYVNHVKQNANIDSNITAGNLALSNGPVITEVSEEEVSSEITEGALTFNKSQLLSPGEAIRFSSTQTVDGEGSRIFFAKSSAAQLIVEDGVEVTLTNTELYGLTNNTISLGTGSKIKVGTGVTFSLTDDVLWDTGQIELVGENNVFEIRSLGRRCTFEFRSPVVDDEYTTHMVLSTHSLMLHNVILKGLRHVSFTSQTTGSVTTTGSVILAGDARVDIDSSPFGTVMSHDFVVRGLDNKLHLRTHDMTLDGAIRFDSTSTSALHVEFVLPSTFHGTPQVNIAAGGIALSSTAGHAYLLFDTHAVALNNKAADSFVLGENGYLGGSRVVVNGNPIVQSSHKAVLRPGLGLTSSLSSGALIFSTELLDAMRSFGTRHVSSFELQELERTGLFDLTRGLELPNEYIKPVVHFESAFTLPELAGNVMLRDDTGGRYTNWRVSTSRDLNLTLDDGIEVVQGAVTTTLKSTDIVNVRGGTYQRPNMLQVSNDLTINGKLLLDDDAVLMIRAVPDGSAPIITFGENSTLSLGARSIILFSGQGTLVLPNNFVLDLGASNGLFVVDDGMQLMLSDSQQVRVQGSGTLRCAHGGQLVCEYGSALRIGSAYSDVVSFEVQTGASVRIGDAYETDSTALSYLSFAKAIGSIDCSQGGALTIAKYGRCELNRESGALLAGELQQFKFGGGGLLYVASGGRLDVADNLSGRSGVRLSLDGGQIGGSGIVGVHGTQIAGQIQNNLASLTNSTALGFGRQLVNTIATLPQATVFIDENSATKIYTKDGALIALNANEAVVSESDDGVITTRHALTGRTSVYGANGVKI